jgi:streptogramin lyase
VNNVASIDPNTMEIKDYDLPEAGAGLAVWRIRVMTSFGKRTSRGYLGRLDADTGKVREWLLPGGPKSEPYDIWAIKDVIIWYSELGTTPDRARFRFDPNAEQFSDLGDSGWR